MVEASGLERIAEPATGGADAGAGAAEATADTAGLYVPALQGIGGKHFPKEDWAHSGNDVGDAHCQMRGAILLLNILWIEGDADQLLKLGQQAGQRFIVKQTGTRLNVDCVEQG